MLVQILFKFAALLPRGYAHEPHQSCRGLQQSMTLRELSCNCHCPPGFGVRQTAGAFPIRLYSLHSVSNQNREKWQPCVAQILYAGWRTTLLEVIFTSSGVMLNSSS